MLTQRMYALRQPPSHLYRANQTFHASLDTVQSLIGCSIVSLFSKAPELPDSVTNCTFDCIVRQVGN